jgi:hypothetical protein
MIRFLIKLADRLILRKRVESSLHARQGLDVGECWSEQDMEDLMAYSISYFTTSHH